MVHSHKKMDNPQEFRGFMYFGTNFLKNKNYV